MRDLYWHSDAWPECVVIQKDKDLGKKVNALVKDILRNGYKASYGKVEMLILYKSIREGFILPPHINHFL